MSTTTITKPLTIQDEQRGSKTVARILLTDPRSGKRVNRRWDTRAEAETFTAAVDAFGLAEALTFDDNRRGTTSKGAASKAGSGTTFAAYAAEYLDRRRTTKRGEPIAASTIQAYRVRLAIVESTPLALTPMRDITADHLEAFIKALGQPRDNGKPLKEGYQNSVLIFVNTVLSYAFKRGDIPSDPSQHVEPIPVTDASEPVILTPAEFAAIADQLGEWGQWERLFFSFLLQSGMRYGELVALKWHQLERDAADPAVTLVRIAGGKTKAAKRTTSIPTALAQQLIPNDSPFIFPEPAEGHFRRHFLKAVRLAQTPANVKAGHEVLMVSPTPHDLRHTHAVLMLTEGHMNLIALAARLGHSSSRTTEKSYAHFADVQMASLGAVAARAAGGFML